MEMEKTFEKRGNDDSLDRSAQYGSMRVCSMQPQLVRWECSVITEFPHPLSREMQGVTRPSLISSDAPHQRQAMIPGQWTK
ncbi:hypothetical protein JZ751_011136 [Albula glossodonta]|uniref:Uncharacterized protein n=1 Tax=Albula glossodonta TaxID=121402 RepID=A0A8T2NY67_9TELE|nr:hypothetical protein JZ751_011136 [Albula glossodonta]